MNNHKICYPTMDLVNNIDFSLLKKIIAVDVSYIHVSVKHDFGVKRKWNEFEMKLQLET